ncbi:MAG: CinA family nicotinamide mononucleotide deamidase-related protein [Desulfobulbus sp.]|nr:CinA family nicotinamide mononucleotide deamidase-related protein [Desulfobulbus sp.]
MIGEIIAIGDELTSGRILNTTSGLAARHLFLLGHQIRAMHTIGDDLKLIGTTLKAAVERSDFILVTGGLGATSDDLTNEAVIKALGLNGAVHPGVKANIESRLGKGERAATSLAKLANLPEGVEVLDPECRMAGYLLWYHNKPLYFLPGVPPQMELLLRNEVVPRLQAFDAGHARPVYQRIYRTCGLYEIDINKRLRPLEHQNIEIGYYPVGAEVHVSLTFHHLEKGEEDPEFLRVDTFIRDALGPYLYGFNDDTLAAVTGDLLMKHGLMLGVAESCTGGLVAASLTEIPGSSRWFKGGAVVYANELKERLLGVKAGILVQEGAVSDSVAQAMAGGTVSHLGCDIAVAATGIAGPDGGTADKPVGTVYLGLAFCGHVSSRVHHFHGSRRQIQEKTAHTAIDMVRRALLDFNPAQ